MAVITESALKLLFEKGDRPTSDNFIDLIDSKLNISEPASVTTNWNVVDGVLYLNESTGRVGIGINSPLAKLHIRAGISGATAHSNANDLILENNDTCGLSILTPDDKVSHIYLGTPGVDYGAHLSWNFNGNTLTLGTNVSSGNIRFQTNELIETMRLTSDGKLGIGLTPLEQLHVKGGYLCIENTNTTYTGIKIKDADGLQWEIQKPNVADPDLKVIRYNDGVSQATPLTFKRDGRIVFNDGNFGIGIEPTTSFHVKKDQSEQSYVKFENNNDSSSSAFIIDLQQGTTPQINLYMGIYDIGYGVVAYQQRGVISTDSDSNGLAIVANNTAGDIRIYTGQATPTTVRMIVTNIGRVGIGTDNPDSTLHVHTASAGTITPSTSADDLVVENNSAGGISILSPDANYGVLVFGSPTDPVGGAIKYAYNSGNPYINIYTHHTNGYLRLSTAEDAEAIRIDKDGNVGINTTSPDEQLHVVGDVKIGTETEGVILHYNDTDDVLEFIYVES